MKFSYTAQRGESTYSDTVEAQDRFEVYRHVRAEGGTILSVTSQAKGRWSLTYWNARLSTIKEHDKIIFASNLSAMMSAGLPISRSLTIAERQTRNPRLKHILLMVRSDIEKGGTFHMALSAYPNVFSKLFVAMVRAGEESGTLGEALTSVASQLEKAYQLKKRIKGALIYPAIIIIAVVGIGFLMMTQVVPTLAKTFESLGAQLPASTRMIMAVSNFLVHYTLLVIIGTGVFIVLFRFALHTSLGQRVHDKVLLTLPLIGDLVKEINSARMARTASSLLVAGVGVISTLEITGEVVQNYYHKAVLYEAQKKVQKGSPLSEVFMQHENLYPPMVGEMIAVGEETGELSHMLERVADFYETEVAQKTKNMSTIIEPFLMLLIGAAVGFFAVAMIGPIYSLSSAF